MALQKFITDTFTPTEKETVVKGLVQNIEDNEEVLAEIFSVDDSVYKNSETYQRAEAMIRTSPHAGPHYHGQFYKFLRLSVEAIGKNKNDYVKMIERSFDREIIRSGLDYRRANLLQLCAGIDILFDWMIKFSAVISAETVQDPYQKEKVMQLYRAEVLDGNKLQAIGFLLGLVNTDVRNLRKMLDEMKDIPFVVERADEMISAYRSKLDPMRQGIIPVIGHIAIFIGEGLNALRKHRRDRAKEILNRIRMDQLMRKRQMEGATEEELESIQKQIDYYNKRIARLEQIIKDLEDV